MGITRRAFLKIAGAAVVGSSFGIAKEKINSIHEWNIYSKYVPIPKEGKYNLVIDAYGARLEKNGLGPKLEVISTPHGYLIKIEGLDRKGLSRFIKDYLKAQPPIMNSSYYKNIRIYVEGKNIHIRAEQSKPKKTSYLPGGIAVIGSIVGLLAWEYMLEKNPRLKNKMSELTDKANDKTRKFIENLF